MPIDKPKHHHNKDFFDDLTNESCYWAGFIAADGYLDSNRHRLKICLSSKDRQILERFRASINFDGNIRDASYLDSRTNNRYFNSSLEIYSASRIMDGLSKNFNILPNKSKYLPSPNITKEPHIISYMVGFIDGDGSIFNNNSRKGLILSITSATSEILEWFKSWFDSWYPEQKIDPAKVYNHKNWYLYKITHSKANSILNRLNSICLPRLDRKWDKVGGNF